jgi:CHASE2 domain-containing sensor protein
VLRGDPATLAKLANRVVLVGGSWRTASLGRGELVDAHETPVGVLPGVLVHANYVEALLTGRTVRPNSGFVHVVADFALGILLACVLIAGVGYWKLLWLAAAAAGVVVVSFMFWQNLGIFLDAAPLLVLLGGHAAVDEVLTWRAAAEEHRSCPKQTNGERHA